MPEKTENLNPEESDGVIEENNKTGKKCKKILKLFRNIGKENVKGKREKKGRKGRKKKFWDIEERKEAFDRNMKSSWADLPNTLKRKKENISEDILSEYQESDSSEAENSKTSSFGNFGKKSKEKSYNLSGSGNGEPTCEFFRQKKEEELDAVSERGGITGGELVRREKLGNNKKKKTSEIILKTSEPDGQISLERIRKLSEDEYEQKSSTYDSEKKNNSYDLKAAVDEINSLFHDLITENGGQNSSSTSSDSGNSEPYVNVIISTRGKPEDECGLERTTEKNMKRCNSSDSLLNGSVSWASDLSQQEVTVEKSKDEGCSILERNTEVTYVNEVIEAREPLSGRKTCCEETLQLLEKLKTEDENTGDGKESTQYCNLLFPQPVKGQEMFVNEHFNEDVSKDKEELERKIIYQELDFVKPEESKEGNSEEKVGEKPEEKPSEASAVPSVISSLSAEQRAKKQSAEAIAKELSSQVFNRKSQPQEETEKKNVLTITINGNYNGGVACVEKKEKKEEEEKEQTENKICEDGKEQKEKEEVEVEEEEWDAGCKSEWGGVSLQYFSVADWRKAVALGCKRGVNSVVMETIVEEPETDTSTKLTVREILRRFEELGNKHFNERLCMTDDERTATLKQIHQTLKCLEEKVKNFENWSESNLQHQQYHENNRRAEDFSSGGWTGRGAPQRPTHSLPVRGHNETEEVAQTSINDGKHSLLQFAIHHFRQSPEKFEMLKTSDGSISGSLKVIESKNKKNKEKGKSGAKDSSEWTWKEQVDLVKFTAKPIEKSLLQLDPDLSDLAVECFLCLMRYMGDLPMPTDVSEVKCVYTILMHCHKYEQLRDEVYCQLMKQTTNNKSIQQESCQRGWRLFSIVAAYFSSSDTLKPFLFKYLETAAYDKRRAYHGTAMVCLQNLRKTFKYGGRKNVPSVEEITAISAGRNSKRQIYRLPGGTEKVVNTKSTTVVQDVIEELCVMINVVNPQEMEEFSVYCIVEGDTFTMPLAREEYILDVTTELHKNHQVFYLIFCRSVWYFPLRLDSQLYVEVVFNQIAPDYLEGLLLILPGESLEQEVIYDISKIAALLHRAADMTEVPTMKETKFLLPKPALGVRDVKPSQWVNMVQSNWQECESLTTIQAKAQVLEILFKWPLFGSSFFAVKKVPESKDRGDHILALNRNGVHFIDLITHETLLHYPFSEVISTRKVKSEDGTLFLDMKCGNLMQQRITRLQTDQAHEISRLIRQYITMQQRMGPNQM